VEGFDSRRKISEDDMSETRGTKSVETENYIVGCRHDEEITSEHTGWIDERKREGQCDEIGNMDTIVICGDDKNIA